MMVKTKTLWLKINGETEDFHHPLDRVNSHLGGFLSSYKVYTMSCMGRVANSNLFWVIIRLFLLFPNPPKTGQRFIFRHHGHRKIR